MGSVKVDDEFIVSHLEVTNRAYGDKAASLLPVCFARQDNDGLKRFVTRSHDMDWLLRLTRKRNRDHSKHQFMVYAIGRMFLKTRLRDSNETLADHIKENIAKGPSNKDCKFKNLHCAWWLASLFHDYAYFFSAILKAMPDHMRESKELKNIPGLQAFPELCQYLANKTIPSNIDHMIPICQDLLVRDDNCAAFKKGEIQHLLKKADPFDHGLWSALSLKVILRELGDTLKESNIGSAVQHALRAICLHTLGKKIDFQKDPIAFLLVLCDELHEWGRETMSQTDTVSECDYITIEGIDRSGNEAMDLPLFSNNLIVTFHFPEMERLQANGWDYLTFINLKSQSLRRLDCKGIMPTIELRCDMPGWTI
jgi:hypothetical protein